MTGSKVMYLGDKPDVSITLGYTDATSLLETSGGLERQVRGEMEKKGIRLVKGERALVELTINRTGTPGVAGGPEEVQAMGRRAHQVRDSLFGGKAISTRVSRNQATITGYFVVTGILLLFFALDRAGVVDKLFDEVRELFA